MPERVRFVDLETLLAALRDHPRVLVDAVPADAAVAQELEEDAAARAQVKDSLSALEKLEEGLRLAADDRLVAAEARLEVHRVKVCRDLSLAPLVPLALKALEACGQARCPLPL